MRWERTATGSVEQHGMVTMTFVLYECNETLRELILQVRITAVRNRLEQMSSRRFVRHFLGLSGNGSRRLSLVDRPLAKRAKTGNADAGFEIMIAL